MTWNNLVRIVTLGTSLAVSPLALAQTAPPTPPPPSDDGHAAFTKVRQACHGDIERLCHDVKPGHGAIRECLKAHEAELSAGCQTAIREARAHHHPRS